jgi:hypothetical protein
MVEILEKAHHLTTRPINKLEDLANKLGEPVHISHFEQLIDLVDHNLIDFKHLEHGLADSG